MKNGAHLTYAGHSALFVTSDERVEIVIDPFLDGNPLCPQKLASPPHLDLIVLTHGHSDHVGSTLALAARHRAKICATYELAQLLVRDGVPSGQLEFMNKGGTVTVRGIEVTLTQAFHSSSYDAKDGTTHYAGEPCGAVLKLESGKTIYHAGDTLLFRDMELIAKRHRPSVALLPIGDRFTMGPDEAAEAVGLIRAPIVIPIHHSTFPLLHGTPERFVAAVARVAPESRVEVLLPGGGLHL